MREDPIVEEARRAGQAYIDSFNGDWKAIVADLNRRSKEEGRQIIDPPLKPLGVKESTDTKNTG
jgi:hypothetical protein